MDWILKILGTKTSVEPDFLLKAKIVFRNEMTVNSFQDKKRLMKSLWADLYKKC